jgi:hypothetical protein
MLTRLAYIVPCFCCWHAPRPKSERGCRPQLRPRPGGRSNLPTKIDVGSKAFRKTRTLLPNASG